MKYFVDTEFYFTTGTGGAAIDPLSIGVVAEDGREFYRVSALAEEIRPYVSSFVRDHVYPNLPMQGNDGLIGSDYVMRFPSMADDLKFFIGDDTPEFWGDYAAFDYVVLSTIMGGFENWPEGWPMFINDFQQLGVETLPSDIPHNALADARALYKTWQEMAH